MASSKKVMDSELVSLLETIEAMTKRPDYEECLNTINLITNLLFELDNRKTAATYTRTLIHKGLTITINFRDAAL